MTAVRESLLAIEANLNNRFAEREEFIRGLLLATLSGQHVFVLGPPGAGKTEIISEYTSCLDGHVFDILMMRTTTPDELFGPPDIPALQKGTFRRNIEGMAPECNVLCLDEIWKGGSATLNGLLRMLAQREFTQCGKSIEVPLLFAVGASNELPEDPSLRALYSRFQLRYVVEQVKSRVKLKRVLWGKRPDLTKTKVSLEDVTNIQSEIAKIGWSQQAKVAVGKILDGLREAGIAPDVRKLVALVGMNGSISQASAFLSGAETVLPEHLSVLMHTLWDTPKHIDLVTKVVGGQASTDMDRLLGEANGIYEAFAIMNERGPSLDQPHHVEQWTDMLKRVSVLIKEFASRGQQVPQKIASRLEEVKIGSATAVMKIRKGK